MLEALGIYIKLAVDVERRILSGGKELHIYCELILLDDGSEQTIIGGADWISESNRWEIATLAQQ